MLSNLQPSTWTRSEKRTLQGIGRQELAPRKPIPARVLVTPLDMLQEPYWGKAETLTTEGVFVAGHHQLQEGAACLLMLLPYGEEDPIWARSEVVHAPSSSGIGCKFTEVAPELLGSLHELVGQASNGPRQCDANRSARKRRPSTMQIGVSIDDEPGAFVDGPVQRPRTRLGRAIAQLLDLLRPGRSAAL